MRRTLGIVLLLAGFAFGSQRDLQVLYIANGVNRGGKGGAITAFRVNNNGTLTPVIGSPFDAAIIPYALATDDGRHLYVANPALDDDNLRVYPIRPETGRLEFEHVSTFEGMNYEAERGCCPGPMLADRSGKFAYVGNTGNKTISVFDIFPGNLALTLNSTVNTRPGHFPFQLIWGPEQSTLFALTDKGIEGSLVHLFERNASTGKLKETSDSPLKVPYVVHAVTDVQGKRLLALSVSPRSSQMNLFSIENSSLKAVPGSPFFIYSERKAMAFALHHSGEWIAIASAGAPGKPATVTMFHLPEKGALARKQSVKLPCGENCNISSLTFDNSGHYLYVADSSQNRVYGFRFDSDVGALQSIPGSPWNSGFQPHSLLVLNPK